MRLIFTSYSSGTSTHSTFLLMHLLHQTLSSRSYMYLFAIFFIFAVSFSCETAVSTLFISVNDSVFPQFLHFQPISGWILRIFKKVLEISMCIAYVLQCGNALCVSMSILLKWPERLSRAPKSQTSREVDFGKIDWHTALQYTGYVHTILRI